jgi:hypothetical protein
MKHKGRRLKPARGEPGRGYRYGHNVHPRASIVFARETFDVLVGEAVDRQIPLSVVVREKIAIALDRRAV